MPEQNPEDTAFANRLKALDIISHVLEQSGSSKRFEIVKSAYPGFDIVHRKGMQISARLSHDGLELIVLGSGKKETVTDDIAAWDFIETHLRSLVPRALFQGELEAELLKSSAHHSASVIL
jgi:hypothetical protein